MPSFSEIEEENNPKNTIIKYAKKLHEKTGRNVIVYYSGWLTIDDERISIDSFDKWFYECYQRFRQNNRTRFNITYTWRIG